MDDLVPILIILATVVAVIGMGIGINKLHDRKRRRQWESGKYGAAGAAGGAAGASGFCGAGGGCAGGSSCGGGGGCGGGCGGG